jgi:peptide/nickel transport system substrate-binding protein
VTNAHPDTPGAPVNEYWANHVAGGGGPFILKEYDPNRRMVLQRNPRFFGKPAASASIIVNFIQSESTRVLNARSGKADITLGLSPDAVAGLRSASNLRVAIIPTFLVQNINLNWSLPPLNNVKFREALTAAVPYDDILRNIVRGYGTRYYGPITPNTRYFNAKASAPRQFDLAKARKLITDSGIKTPVSLQIVILQGDAVAERIATVLQNVWKGIGINLTVSRLGPTEYNTVVFGKKAQMSIRIDGPGAPVPSWHLLYDMKCGSGFNASGICIPQADKLLDRARKSRSDKERQQLYNTITRLWRAQSPKIILYGIKDPTVLSKRAKLYHWNGLCCDMQTWK